jgi:hypothetical protein
MPITQVKLKDVLCNASKCLGQSGVLKDSWQVFIVVGRCHLSIHLLSALMRMLEHSIHSGLYIARAKGFYAEAGLPNVQIRR